VTEYELNDAIQTISSNLIAGEALFLTVLSAYGIIAYTSGVKLNTYQIAFVNFVFVGFVLTNLGALYAMTEQAYHYGERISEFLHRPEIEEPVGLVLRWLMFTVRSLMAIGALAFMWQVRNSRDSRPS
jgi:hypothetical protein